jgi:hypothetical protein
MTREEKLTVNRYWFGEWLDGWCSVAFSKEDRDRNLRGFLVLLGGMAGEW